MAEVRHHKKTRAARLLSRKELKEPTPRKSRFFILA
jgi:hypothetical protein